METSCFDEWKFKFYCLQHEKIQWGWRFKIFCVFSNGEEISGLLFYQFFPLGGGTTCFVTRRCVKYEILTMVAKMCPRGVQVQPKNEAPPYVETLT